MGTKIIDLDEVLGDDKHVKAGGKTYTLPPDIPVELYLNITRAAAEGNATEFETIERLHDGLLELFQYGDPKLKALPLTVAQCVLAIPMVYGTSEEPEAETAPPRRTRGGGSSRSRSGTRSRS